MRPKVERQFIVFAVMALLAVVIINNSSGGLPSFNSVGTPQATAATDDAKSATPLSGSIQECCTPGGFVTLPRRRRRDYRRGRGWWRILPELHFDKYDSDGAGTDYESGGSLIVRDRDHRATLYAAGERVECPHQRQGCESDCPCDRSRQPLFWRRSIKADELCKRRGELAESWILVLGYDWSNYGVIGGGGDYYTSTADIENNMTDYTNWYHVNGTFFDGMAYTSSYESDYQTWVSFASGLGQTYTMGNPGADTLAGYVGITNSINIYENPSLPSISFLGGWHADYAKSNFALIAYSVSSTPSQSYIDSATQYVGYLYVSDQGDGYQTLPSYMSAEMQELAIANSG